MPANNRKAPGAQTPASPGLQASRWAPQPTEDDVDPYAGYRAFEFGAPSTPEERIRLGWPKTQTPPQQPSVGLFSHLSVGGFPATPSQQPARGIFSPPPPPPQQPPHRSIFQPTTGAAPPSPSYWSSYSPDQIGRLLDLAVGPFDPNFDNSLPFQRRAGEGANGSAWPADPFAAPATRDLEVQNAALRERLRKAERERDVARWGRGGW